MNDPRGPSRREALSRLVLGGLAMGLMVRRLEAMSRLPEGRSIYRLSGRVLVNGAAATLETPIRAGDTVETGAGAEVVFAVGADAFMLRADGRMELAGRDGVVNALRIITGKLLSVYGSGPKQLSTPIATIGIRGTGVYIESEPRRTYLCTCYGAVDMASAADAAVRETVKTYHHDSPRFIFGGPGERPRIETAPVFDHTDAELSLLESLVGRVPLFARGGGGGGGGGDGGGGGGGSY